MTADRIHFFHPGQDAEPAPKAILGGKGQSLAAMSRAGLPVPPGFTIATVCCRAYHEAGGRWPEGLDAEVRKAVAWLEERTGRTFGRGPSPLFVAVRSGAAVSMPGMMDTVLNVGKDVSGDPWNSLEAAITAVFESWNSERARRYRAKHDIRGLAGSAVTVQAMFPSERSGVLFTQDPNRPDADRIVIEAARGLGEAVVQGHVQPDVYSISREDRTVRERVLAGSEPSLTEKQILELSELGLRTEGHFGTPVDIEWGLADGRFVLLQSRPIRGLDVARDVPAARRDEIDRLRARVNGREKAWAAHNLGETLPAPTPLTWDIIGRGFMSTGFVKMYRDLGFRPSDRLEREGFLELIAGRVYADVHRAAELFFGTFPLEYDLSSGGSTAALLLERPTRFNVERAGAGFLLKLPFHLYAMLRAGRIQRRTARTGLDDLERRILPSFSAYVEKERATDLKGLSEGELLSRLAERERIALNEYGAELMKPGYLAGYFHGRLSSTLEQILGTAEARALGVRLLAGLDGDKTLESNVALSRVAEGEMTLDAWLGEFGHRAVNELELSERRWREDDGYLHGRIRQLRRSKGIPPAALHEGKKKDRLDAEAAIPRLLEEAGATSLEADLRADLEGAQRHLPWRETCKHHFMRGVALVRDVLEELAARWDLGRNLYFLRRDELARYAEERERLSAEIEKRRIRWKALQRLPVPEVLRSTDLEALGREERLAPSGEGVYTGTGVAAGIGTGPVRRVNSPEDADDLGTGYVLVCPTTDPSWTPLFVHAAAIVVERGGMLSHGAIVARDFGIPAVVLPQAMRLLPEGAGVRVDGNTGRVERRKD